MKSPTITLLLSLAVLPLYADDKPAVPVENQPAAGSPDWRLEALHSQSLMKQFKFAEAAEFGQRALQLAKREGVANDKLASTYHLLGVIYRNWGHCAEARTNYAHAIAAWHREKHPNERYLFTSITNYLSVLCECDDFKTARKEFKTYEPELNRYRSDPLDDAKLISIQAVLARAASNYVLSETLFRQSLEMMAKSSHASAIDIAAERSNLSVVLDKQGRYDEALEQSREVIAVLEQKSPHHPSLVAALNNAACALDDLGKLDESERAFQRALALATDLYGEDNHVTAKIMLSYAAVLRHNKQSPEAEAWHKKGVEAFRRALLHDNATVDVSDLRR